MKGRYAGCRMTIYGSILPGAASIARSAALTEQLTERALYKVSVLDWHKTHGGNVSLTARHFGLGRATTHRWLGAYKARGLYGLNEQSRKPKRVRQPSVSPDIVFRIVRLRKQYRAWSKYKIKQLLNNEGITVSSSTIGRVLKRRCLIDKKKSQKRRRAALRPRARFPHGFSISKPGDMLQLDTKYIMLPGGRKLYQFTAIDVLTKLRVLRVYPSQSSRNGAKFLKECIASFPFHTGAVQTDNGAPFLKEFEKLCKELNMPHYFIYPGCPKQNTYVERSHGSDEEEFYQLGNTYQDKNLMGAKLQEWQNIWNNVRPHQALDYLTPVQYFTKLQTANLPTKDVIILQT